MRHKLSDIVWIDFETFYSNDYSLRKKKYNLSSYIRDPQFKAHCVAIRDGYDSESFWYETSDIKKALRKHGVAGRPVCCHNTAFDGLILSEIYGILCPYYYDTLGMARGLHGTLTRNDLDTVGLLYGIGGKKPNVLRKAKGVRELPPELLNLLGDYCANDNDVCARIAYKQLEVYPDDELDLIDWTIRAFVDPVLYVDQAYAKAELDEQIAIKEGKVQAAEISPTILQSAELFAEALRSLGVEPPLKISKTTGELTYAFAKSDWQFTDMLNWEERPDVVRLVEARLAVKSSIGETRAQRFIDIGSKPLPVGLNYCGAHTTRWSGGNKMNLQNLPRPLFEDGKKVEGSGRLRESIIAPPGHVILVGDSGQIEARLNAWFSDQIDLLHLFQLYDKTKDPQYDPYRVQAAVNTGKNILEIDKNERFVGKVCTLGLGYQMGPPRLRATLALGMMGPPVDISEDDSKRFVFGYRTRNHKIVENWERCENILIDMLMGRSGGWKCIEWDGNSIWGPNGLGLHYYHLQGIEHPTEDRYQGYKYLERNKAIDTYGGKLTENIIQFLGRTVIGEQLLYINDQLPQFITRRGEVSRVVSMTHDEIIAVVPLKAAEKAQELLLKEMRITPKWAPGLPLFSEGGFDVRYSK